LSAIDVRAAVVTISDRVARGEAQDGGGARVVELLAAAGIETESRRCVADERHQIAGVLDELAAGHDLVVTTGGTGIGARDVTPEATLDVIDRRLPGFEEAMRAEGAKATPLAMLSRGVVGTRGPCLIINLPGSPSAIDDGLRAVLVVVPHAIALLRRVSADCAPERARFER